MRARTHNFLAWGAEFSFLIFNSLKIGLKKCACDALHTVHAVPELRVAARRLRDRVSLQTSLLVASTLDFAR